MQKKEISDKALIRSYLKEKGISRLSFCTRIGVSRSFLDGESSITGDNLRRILRHPDYEDFNLDAFIRQDENNMVKKMDALPDSLANQQFVLDTVRLITELKMSDKIEQEEAVRLLECADKTIELLSSLSENYQELYKNYQKLYVLAERSANTKKGS
ncbi:MAG: hypothetical protein MJA30_20905 [Cytophagales bacterium]|nr:hypothetical protein [Cytophagales bacterium]